MILTAWRIYKPKHAATAFTGEGARLFGGRLNSKGVAVVYTSGTLSLAALEMLVHLQSAEILDAYVTRSVSFDTALVKRIDAGALPANWNANPPPPAMRKIGDDWIAKRESAVLQVPSAVVEKESNFLLNPAHPDFRKIVIGKEEPFNFDARFVKPAPP